LKSEQQRQQRQTMSRDDCIGARHPIGQIEPRYEGTNSRIK
jgi:hypothetical protein